MENTSHSRRRDRCPVVLVIHLLRCVRVRADGGKESEMRDRGLDQCPWLGLQQQATRWLEAREARRALVHLLASQVGLLHGSRELESLCN